MCLPLPFSLTTASQIFIPETSWQTLSKELQYDNLRWAEVAWKWPHDLTTITANKTIRSPEAEAISLGADFMTTCLTTFRTGLPGDSSTRRTLYQFFRTKKHVLDAISRKKTYPFAWGGRGRKFKSCHSDQALLSRCTKERAKSKDFSSFFVCFWHFLSASTILEMVWCIVGA